MHLAINKLKINPQYIVADGNHFSPYKKIPFKCIIKGDSKYQNLSLIHISEPTRPY